MPRLAWSPSLPARVVASWLTLLDAVDANPTGNLADVWPAGSILIVDEATQVGTRDAARLLAYAARTGTVVILLGDPAQLGSVAAGGWFRHLVETTPNVPTLTTVHRQAGPEMAAVRAALDALRAESGTPLAALERLAAAGKIHLVEDPGELFAQVVADWYAERRRQLDATTTKPDAAGPADGAARPPPALAPRPVKAHRPPRSQPLPPRRDRPDALRPAHPQHRPAGMEHGHRPTRPRRNDPPCRQPDHSARHRTPRSHHDAGPLR
jgi:hypothetical protein